MTNYFKIFDLDQRYDIDLASLKSAYLKKQAEFHPDRAKDARQKIEFLEKSMQANDAYKTLIDDYTRAEHLLSLGGQELNEETAKGLLSVDELERIWQDNEALDDMTGLPALYQFEKEKLAEQKELTVKLTDAFARENSELALDLTVKLKYLTNLVKNTRLKIKDANS